MTEYKARLPAPARRSDPEAARGASRHEALERRRDHRAYGELLSARPSGPQPAQRAAEPNRTGLPDRLKSGVEALSGVSLDEVKVHYNSARPAELDALAYAQGTDIHLAPGQEQHLPHEAWHVVQQAQGRVKPTMQMKDGVPVNDDAGLEHEADVMGTKAATAGLAHRDAPTTGEPPQAAAGLGHSGRAPTVRQAAGGLRSFGGQDAAVIQRLTIAYTAADMNHPPAVAPAFADEMIEQVVHQRAAIPNAVRHAVDAFGDNSTPPVTYKHHVAYNTTCGHIRNLCEPKSRTDIVDEMGVRCDLVGVDTATFGLNPLAGVASFNTWLDSAIVALCDWPENIFRGPSGGGDPDHPTAAHPHNVAVTARLGEARNTLNDAQ